MLGTFCVSPSALASEDGCRSDLVGSTLIKISGACGESSVEDRCSVAPMNTVHQLKLWARMVRLNGDAVCDAMMK